MKRREVKQTLAFRFCYIFILIQLLWMLVDFLQVHNLASGLSLIPDEVWHLVIGLCAPKFIE